MEWSSFPAGVLLLLILSLFLALTAGDFSTGAYQAVRCMLTQTTPAKCSEVTDVQIPSYLIKAYNDSPSSLHEALRSAQLAQLTNEQIASLPLALLYLIPRGRLSDLSGPQLAAILQKHSADTSLAHQLRAGAQREKQLVEMLKLSQLSQDVLHVLGESVNKADLSHILRTLPLKESLLAYLRPSVMLHLDKMAFDVLLHLQGIQPLKLPKRDSIYTIAQMAISNHFPFSKIKWLVSGLSPDEIRNDTLEIELNYQHFKLDLTNAQARAVFEQIYKNVNPTKSDLIDYLPVLPKLTPSMLQRLPALEYHYDSLLKLPLPQSLATACQIQEYIKANCYLTGKLLKTEDVKWEFRIHYLDQWVFTLPLKAFEEYISDPLDTAHLLDIESSSLSALQAYYLTGKGQAFDLSAHNSVKVPESLLQALPTSQLLTHSSGHITSTVVEHLASSLPGDNVPRTLAFLSKISSVLSENSILENLLDNSDVNSIISLMSPKDFKVAVPKMLKWFKEKHEVSPIIRQLPQQILAALLEHVQQSDNWSWDNLLDRSHVSHLLVGGLTCQHIKQMEPGLFIPIMAEYNRHRKQDFPRNLQICSLQKLISYLKFKMAITQTDPSVGLISMLEPIEIESVGGYILAGLPVEALRLSPYLGQILVTIGKLSNAELILAANMTQLFSIAQLVINKEGNADVYVAGNLVWYLPQNTTLAHFKLMLQSGSLDTTLCLPQHLRLSLASSLMAEFGPPEGWSAGVLATLQDLLLVFTEEDLSLVSRTVWTDAADTLISHYGDRVNWIKPMPFHQVCTSFLEEKEEIEYKSAVRRLIRRHLQAAQWMLNTVKPPLHASLSKKTVMPIDDSDVDETEETSIGAFNPSLTEDVSSTSEPSTSTTESEVTSSTTESTTTSEPTTSTETTASSEITTEITTTGTTETTTEIKISTTQSSSSTAIQRSTEKEETTDTNVNASDSNSITTTKSTTQFIKATTTKISIDEIKSEPPLNRMNTSSNIQDIPNAKDTEENIFENNSYSNTNNKTTTNATTSKEENNNLNTTTVSSNITPPTNTNISLNNSLTNTLNKVTNSSEKNVSKDSSNNLKNITTASPDETNKQFTNSEEGIDSRITNFTDNENEIKPLSDHSKDKLKGTTITKHSPTTDSNSYIIEEDKRDGNKAENEIESIFGGKISSDSINKRRRRSIFQPDTSVQLSCNALRMVGQLSAIALTEKDLKRITDSEIEECRVEFGAMDLSFQFRKHLWKRISPSKKKEGTHLLGGLLQAATVGDVWDFRAWHISDPWALETVHALNMNLDDHTVLKKVFGEVERSNSQITPELLAALGPSLCMMEWNTSSSVQFPVAGLQPPATCRTCLADLAKMAVHHLGPVASWTQHYVHSLNDIVAGLELQDWKDLTESSSKPLSALQPSAITCLNNSHIEVLTADHISMIPTLTLHALLPQQIAALNETQVQALRMATQVSVEDKLTPTKPIRVELAPSSGGYTLASSLILFASLLFSFSSFLLMRF